MNRTTNFNRLNDNGLNEMQITNPAIKQRRIATATQRTPLWRQLAVLAVMLIAAVTATAQTQYVFMRNNGDDYYYANNNTWSSNTTFNPSYIWTLDNGVPKNNGRYLIISRGGNWQAYSYSASLSNSLNDTYTFTLSNGNVVTTTQESSWSYYGNNNATYYLPYDLGTLATNTTPNNRVIAYQVTTTENGSSTEPTISGNDVLSATTTYNYSAAGAAYQPTYTNYRFNNANHYFDANGTSFTGAPADATIGAATWSISDNAYATVNASNGTVTVNSLPESDIELTLTVTYPVTGGNPAVASGINLIATKTITIQGTNPSAPTITVNGTSVTLATDAVGSTTIRYTIDGSDPTPSTGTVYSGTPIDISSSTTSPVIIKAITVRNGNASSVTEQSVQLTLPAPVITADASAGTATISCANAGATIYYTTDGTTPSATNGTAYTGQISGLSLMTTLQAIAVWDGWNDSPVTSTTLTLPSGTDGTTVTLFDYEPHSWSYYSDADCPIRSLNPADVKITYYGDGQTENNMTTTDTKDIPTSFGTKATGVRVSATEAENTFVYYKTLERTNGEGAASKAAANGAAMYTTIPNPFQVRPTGQDNGSQIITPSTRTIVVVTSRSENNTSAFDENGTLTVSYGTFSQVISGRTTTTISGVPVGTTVSLVFDGSTSSNNKKNRCRVTVYYETASGTTAVTQYNPNYTPNNSFTVAAPASQTVSFGTYRGFYAWRVKSKSASITSITDADGNAFANNIIPAETDIRINTTSEYGNEIEFEALWAQAYATTGSTDLPYAVSSSVPSAYERNFHILNTSTEASNFQKTYPCTVIGREPNSTTLNTTRAVTGGFTAAAATKFEELNITNATGSTWTANNHDLIIGRGCTGTVNIVRGMGGNTSEALDYTIRLESGVFNYVSFTAGYYDYNDGNNAANLTFSGTDNSVRGVMGCDYDRAVEESTANYNYTNAPLRVINNMILGATPSLSNQTEKEYFNATIKSGSYGTRGISTASAGRSFYFGMANTFNTGKRKVTIEGGQLNLSLAGGIDEGNTSDDAVTVRMKGGTVAGSVYGAAAFSSATGGRRFIFTGGTVGGWIAGGCNGTQTTGGKLEGKTFIYFGGTAQCNSNGSNTTIGPGNATGGNIFGAGSGNASATATATVGEVDQSTIVIADQSMVERNVYGGGNYGYVAGTGNTNKSDIYILGGDVRGSVFGGANMQKGNIVNITMKDGLVENGLYGGSNTRGDIAGNVTIQVDGGTVGQGNAGNGIFGGGYGQTTTVNGNVSVTLGTCTAGDVTVYGDVYGGSALGTVNDATSDKTTVSLYNGTIRGGIYGGGYGPGGVAANVNGAVEVKVFGGSVLCSESDPKGEAGSGSVFGCNNAGGAPQSTVKVDIYKTDAAPGEGQYALHAVYGGGNKANYSGTPVVTIHGCNSSIEYVYGGGNASDVEGTNVTIWGGTIGYAFGGGNGYSVTGNHTNQSADHYNPGANITTEGTNLKIYGGIIGAAFGGSNQYGTINDSVQVTVDSRYESNEGIPACVDPYTTCPLSIGELYSGGNEAALISSRSPLAYITPDKISVSLSCFANIGMLFGGAKAANYEGDINLVVDGGTYTKVFGGNNKGGTITGNVTVTFNGGRAGEVYGGCNESGDITGNITVNIDSTNTTCTPRFYVENVYGGGNLAAYGGSPVVNIINGTVQENVYGGGYGSTAEVAGSPAVTVGVSNTEKRALVLGNVFGGGNAAPVSGDTDVKILYNSYIKGNVYGGGNKATVSGDTKVNIGN